MAIIDVGAGYQYASNDAGVNAAISAASSGDTIFLRDQIINIEGVINVNKSIIFRGDDWNKTTILLGVYAGGVPTIVDENARGTNQGVFRVTANNVEFCHFKAYAPDAIKSDDPIYGGGHGDQRNVFYLREVYGCKFHDIKVPKYVYNDVIRFSYSHDCSVKDCEFLGGNHDTISYLHSYNITVDNCLMAFATNTCMRWYYAHGITVSRLTIDGNLGGQSCFEMQNQDGVSSIDRVLVKNVTKPFMTYGQGACAVSNTVICTGCNPNCAGDNIITNASASTDWASQGYGYNSSLVPTPTPNIQITAKSPAVNNISVTSNQSVTFSVNTNVDCTVTIMIQGNNYTMNKINNYTYTKDFIFVNTGSYTVEVSANKSGYNSISVEWNVSVNPITVSTQITSVSPSGSVKLETNVSKIFTITLNQSDTIKWYLDNVLVDSVTGTSDSISISFSIAETHKLKVMAGTAFYVWDIIITQPVIVTKIINTTPANIMAIENNTSKDFNITLNQPDTIKWYLNNVLSKTVNNVSDTLSILFPMTGVYVIKAVVGNDTNVWNVTVINNSTPTDPTDPIDTNKPSDQTDDINNTSSASSMLVAGLVIVNIISKMLLNKNK